MWHLLRSLLLRCKLSVPRCKDGIVVVDVTETRTKSAFFYPAQTTRCHIGGVIWYIADTLKAVASSSCME